MKTYSLVITLLCAFLLYREYDRFYDNQMKNPVISQLAMLQESDVSQNEKIEKNYLRNNDAHDKAEILRANLIEVTGRVIAMDKEIGLLVEQVADVSKDVKKLKDSHAE